MAFSPAFMDELRRRVSIVELVGRKVRLQRRGNQATGLCPFHNEKSPSFHVYDDDEPHYHCFGCGAHGDAITFVMQTEGLEFRDAVERLAGEAGLEVPKDTPQERERAERQAGLGTVMEESCRVFEKQLTGSPGAAYLARRGLSVETIRRFRLGFAPESRTALKSHLAKVGIPEALSIEAGMLIKPEDGGPSYDRFRGRVMFPIADAKGRIIAFGGRTLGDEKPKYLNSPETPLFSKGRQLYNLNHAQKAARDKQEIIVVEGYMDVIALSEAGFAQAVAPLGTALTEAQIALLWRLAPEPILCFDGDAAGQNAAARAVERAMPILKPGLSLRFAWMPAGQDPDDLVRSGGAGAVRTVLDRAEPLVQVAWDQTLAGRPLDTPERRSGFRRDLFAMADQIHDPAVRQAYRQEIETRLASLYSIGPNRERAAPGRPAFSGAGRVVAQPLGGQAARRGTTGLRMLPYETLLATVINHPELLHRHSEALAAQAFPAGPLDKLKCAIIDHATRSPRLDSGELQNHLKGLGYSAALDGVVARTGSSKWTLPAAGLAQAEEGLLHVMGVLRERNEVRGDIDEAALRLRQSLEMDASGTDEAGATDVSAVEARATDDWERLRSQQSNVLEGESRRSDLDRDDPSWDRPQGQAKTGIVKAG
ncbi:MAG TPA: DNA primase [Candidatus Cybelea sp.]|nr:DNA primase [Candidatus Cybelea sp.]